MVKSFKKMPGQQSLSNEQEFFNSKLPSPRVLSEHCIGILKNRFPVLKTINIRIRGGEQLKEIMDLVEACSVLHNILLKDDNIPQPLLKNKLIGKCVILMIVQLMLTLVGETLFFTT